MIRIAIHFTDSGKAWVVDKLDDSSATVMNKIAWGTGAGTAAENDTTLFTEASEARVTGTVSQDTTTITGDTYKVTGTMTASGDKTITNAGLFDAASAGNMLIKGDFPGISVISGDGLAFTFKLHVDQ